MRRPVLSETRLIDSNVKIDPCVALIHIFEHDHAVTSYKQNITPQYYSTITYHHIKSKSISNHQSNEFNDGRNTAINID